MNTKANSIQIKSLIIIVLVFILSIINFTYLVVEHLYTSESLNGINSRIDYLYKKSEIVYPDVIKPQEYAKYRLQCFDSVLKISFIVESNGQNVIAVKDGNILWNTNPIKGLSIYRERYPVITYLNVNNTIKSEYIDVSWSNSRFGKLNKITGEFVFEGQD